MSTAGGVFVVFEGGDGVGKTTQVDRLCAWLANAGHEVLKTFEPGDTTVGAMIRRIVLDPATGEMSPRAEALLYAADKAQHIFAVVRPALERGAVVVCDRYVDSMLAYQGAGRVLELADLERIARWATEDLRPDLTVVLDAELSDGIHAKAQKDRLESAGDVFHERTRQFFLELARREPERYLVLRPRVTRGDCGPGGRSGRALAHAGTPSVTSEVNGRVFDMTAPPTDSAAAGTARCRPRRLGGADRSDGSRRDAAARGGRRTACHESRLVVHRSSRFRTIECGAGFRRGAAMQLRRLREVHRMPYVVVRCASRRHAGAHRAAVDRRRRGARACSPIGHEPDSGTVAGHRDRGRRSDHRTRGRCTAEEHRGAGAPNGVDLVCTDR